MHIEICVIYITRFDYCVRLLFFIFPYNLLSYMFIDSISGWARIIDNTLAKSWSLKGICIFCFKDRKNVFKKKYLLFYFFASLSIHL